MARPTGSNRKQAISVTIDRENLTVLRVLGKGNISEGIAEVMRRFKAVTPTKDLNKMIKAAAEVAGQEENELLS